MTVEKILDIANRKLPFPCARSSIVVLALIGSDSHNTKLTNDDPSNISDTDYMCVVIPPLEYELGMQLWDSTHVQEGEIDCVFYSFRKFITLLAGSNPNIFMLPWLHSKHILFESATWRHLQSLRHLLVSTAVYNPFIKYAESQLKKMTTFDINTQNEWDNALQVIRAAGYSKEMIVTNAHRTMPNLSDVIQLVVENNPGVYITELGAQELVHKSIETIKRIHTSHFQGYMGDKRKNLVRKHGYDVKNAAHLVRISRMCAECLETGIMTVYREDDAEEIKDIKRGKFTLDEVKDKALLEFSRAALALQKNPAKLPNKPNLALLEHCLMYNLLDYYTERRVNCDE